MSFLQASKLVFRGIEVSYIRFMLSYTTALSTLPLWVLVVVDVGAPLGSYPGSSWVRMDSLAPVVWALFVIADNLDEEVLVELAVSFY